MPPDLSPLHIIMNPAAGAGRLSPDDLAARCVDAGLDVVIATTYGPGSVSDRVRAAVADGAGCVAAYGGDGTVAAVAAGLAGLDVPLAILPGGTANILAVNLGIPRKLDRALALLAGADHAVQPLDLGWANDHAFLVRASVGFEAAAIVESERGVKRALGPWGYAVAALRALNPQAHPLRARFVLTLDGELVELAAVNVFVGNAPGLGRLGLVLGADVRPDDGLLDVIAVDVLPGSLIGMAARALRLDALSRGLRRWPVQTARIESRPALPVHADGEAIGQTPVSVRVQPGAVRVVVPGRA